MKMSENQKNQSKMNEEGAKKSVQSKHILKKRPRPQRSDWAGAFQNFPLKGYQQIKEFYDNYLYIASMNKYQQLVKEFQRLDSNKRKQVMRNIQQIFLQGWQTLSDENKFKYGIGIYKHFYEHLIKLQQQKNKKQKQVLFKAKQYFLNSPMIISSTLGFFFSPFKRQQSNGAKKFQEQTKEQEEMHKLMSKIHNE